MTKERDNSLAFSFQSSLPVMAGYIVLGMGFGILLQSKGYGFLWALAMSVFIYAGSMQYVAVDLLAGGVSLVTAAVMTIMVNIRHIFYGITMLDRYKQTGKEKLYLIFALTDETFSLVCSPKLPENVELKKYYLFLSAMNQSYWILGCVVGNLLGNILPFASDGVDFSMTALFLVIVIDQWENNKNHLPALTGIVVTFLCLLLFGESSFLIPSMIVITIALFLEKKWNTKEEAANE